MKPKKITEKQILSAVKATADHYVRIVANSPRGVPDCLVTYKGKTFFVEVKTEGDRASASQKAFARKFETVFIWPKDWFWFSESLSDAAASFALAVIAKLEK